MRDPNQTLSSGFEVVNPERFQAAQTSTWVSVAVNVVLTVLQIVVGYFARSQALIADGLHSLSDLLSDFLVLYANRHGSRSADALHPYGHARIETAATLILGIFLAGMGVALLFAAGIRLQNPKGFQQVHVAALWIGVLALIGKEALFRYLMAVAKRLRSQMLMANAWHSRSDAASSLVVVAGIAGNLAGFTFLDLLAAALVGFMIARMGWKLGWEALSELIDTGLSEEQVEAIRATLLGTPGVRGIHELRTRKMADQALVDAHIVVDPRISVSEGHFIAELARKRVLSDHEVLDVMVHIDPEDDYASKPSANLPDREELLGYLSERLGEVFPRDGKIVLHYLEGKVEAEVFLDAGFCVQSDRLKALQDKIDDLMAESPYFRNISLHRPGAR